MGQIKLQTDEASAIRNKLINLNQRQFDVGNKLNSLCTDELYVLWDGEVPGAFGTRFRNIKRHTATITEMMNKYTDALDFAIKELEEADRRAAEQRAREEAERQAAEEAARNAALAAAAAAAVQVGTQIPRSSSAYQAAGNNPFARGQCTWYAWGRVKEITGKNILFSSNSGRDAKMWPSLVKNGAARNVPERGFVMVDTSGKHGHVAVVERAARLSNGDYKIVYSDANVDKAIYYENPATDGTVKEILLSKMGTRGFDTFLEIT